MYEYKAKVIRVIDGDTIAFAVDLGCDVTVNLTVRLANVDCPEAGSQAYHDARLFTLNWLSAAGDHVMLHTIKDKREKYGRYLGEVYGIGKHLNADLVAEGHAVRYTGRR